jgi:hypothetical protein
MSNPLTTAQVKAKLKEINEVQKSDPDVVAKTDADIIAINRLIKEIEDGGWHLQIQAYSNKVDLVSRGRRRLLKKPRNEWRIVARWVHGNENVWYYNQKAESKAHALDMQARYP